LQHGAAIEGKHADGVTERMKAANTRKVSEAELKAAMRRFIAAGGMIKKLPDQKGSASHVVGRRWASMEISSEPT